MDMPSIEKEVRQRYIEEYLESSQKTTYTHLPQSSGLTPVFFDELSQNAMRGFPTASDMVAPDGTVYTQDEFAALSEERKRGCRLRYCYLPSCHELYVGTTGSGKTTGCVEPQLRAISAQKNKPNLFVTDAKGEIFERNAHHLKKMGYQLFVLNYKDLTKTDRWNPLLDVFDKKMSLQQIGEGATEHYGEVPYDLELAADISEFDDFYIEYKGKAFPDDTLLDKALRKEAENIEIEVESLVNALVETFFAAAAQQRAQTTHAQQAQQAFETAQMSKTQQNGTWEKGAQNLLKGLIYCMLEDAADPETGFTRDMMTIRTLERYYLALKTPILSNDCNLFEHELTEEKSAATLSLLSSAFDNTAAAAKNITETFERSMAPWFCGNVFALTTGDTVDICHVEEPFAFFIISRGSYETDRLLTAPALDWAFRKMAERAETDLHTRAVHFLLDDFGSILQVKDFAEKISAARAHNIWFHLFVQSYNQLQDVYGKQTAQIIKDNCTAHVFLGVQNAESQEEFSQMCGKHHVPTLTAQLKNDDNSLALVDVLPKSALDLLEKGKMFVKRLRMPVFLAEYVPGYVCEECGVFDSEHCGLKECAPFSWGTFTSAKYTYKRAEDCIAHGQNAYDEDDDF